LPFDCVSGAGSAFDNLRAEEERFDSAGFTAEPDRGELAESQGRLVVYQLPANDNDRSPMSDVPITAMTGLGGYSIAFDIYATPEAQILSSSVNHPPYRGGCVSAHGSGEGRTIDVAQILRGQYP